MRKKVGLSLVTLLVLVILIILIIGIVYFLMFSNKNVNKIEDKKNETEVEITSDIIKSNPTMYIGKSVKYTGYSENTNTIDWRIFGVDENTGNILIRANDYVNLAYKGKNPSTGIKTNGYKIYSNVSRESLINYLTESKNWNEYAINGTMAKGATTLKQFIDSYNLVNNSKLEIEYLSKENLSSDGKYKAKSAGYTIREQDGEYTDLIEQIGQECNGMNYYINSKDKVSAMWLASESAEGRFYLYCSFFGSVCSEGCDYPDLGICPIVELTSTTLVQKSNSDFYVK